MNRGLVSTLCTLAVLAAGSVASAQNVQLSLNLRYTHPNVPSQGGTWTLVAKTDDADGIAAINAYISNINTTGIAYGAGINAALNAGSPYVIPGAPVNLLYFQDTSAAGVVVDVGQGAGTPGNQLVDPLRNGFWNSSAVIATGSFGGTLPAFAPKGANVTDANTLSTSTAPFNNSTDAATTFIVRGDAVVTLGSLTNVPGVSNPKSLLFGDRNRSGTVTFNADVLPAFNNIGKVAPNTWEDGDFSGNGTITFNADVLAAFNNIGQPAPPAPIAAVPEPASFLLLISGLGLWRRSRRS